jgi:putative restriction endonuclease
VPDLEKALAMTSGQHRVALDWFKDHQGEIEPWKDIQIFSEENSRLVNQAKGIYKPAYGDYALSIRTIQDGPYPDKDVEHRPDGSWVLHYFQENPNPEKRDREATNRGLMKCMADGVPVGALIKRKGKPGVTYEVLGLGLVTGWEEGFFMIEGFSVNGEVHKDRAADATRLRATIGSSNSPFIMEDDRDLRDKVMAQVARRRGQSSFRAALLHAYKGICCVTGCTLRDALEAAHIVSYKGDHSHNVQNGLILRSDIHTLFDLGLLALTPEYRIKLAPNLLEDGSYAALEGCYINLPDNHEQRPSRDALLHHQKWANI